MRASPDDREGKEGWRRGIGHSDSMMISLVGTGCKDALSTQTPAGRWRWGRRVGCRLRIAGANHHVALVAEDGGATGVVLCGISLVLSPRRMATPQLTAAKAPKTMSSPIGSAREHLRGLLYLIRFTGGGEVDESSPDDNDKEYDAHQPQQDIGDVDEELQKALQVPGRQTPGGALRMMPGTRYAFRGWRRVRWDFARARLGRRTS